MTPYHFKLEEEPSIADIMWAAGIYEGEGHATCSNGCTFHIKIDQKDPWILYKLQKTWGGSVKLYKVYRWYVSSINAVQFCSFIYEYLSPWRQKQIDQAKSFSGIVYDFDKYHWLREITPG